MKPLPIVVLISGGGSNLQAIIDAVEQQHLPVEIRAVISNCADAYGLQRARNHGIETRVIDHREFADRERFDKALQQAIDSYAPGLVVLAGFMRILTSGFVAHYQGRLFNIHPSLLPDYRGLHTHRRALEANDTRHGASVHFVTGELDGGPVVIQAEVPVLPDDDPEILAARVLVQEHKIYPQAIRWFAEGRLRLDNEKPYLDGKLLERPVQWDGSP